MLGRACVGGRQAAGRLHRAATTQLRQSASRLQADRGNHGVLGCVWWKGPASRVARCINRKSELFSIIIVAC